MTPQSANTESRSARSLAALWKEAAQRAPFDLVIVGSGYGGAAAAAALAGATNEAGEPISVCILERGREYLPGDFPSRFGELPAHLRVGHQNSGEVGQNHEGLYDLRLGDDVVALVANGLGGGSLINAGVMLQPDSKDFDDPHWRSVLGALANGDDDGNDSYFRRARRALGGEVDRDGRHVRNDISRHPDLAKKPLRKTLALQGVATGSAQPFSLPPITVAMDDGPNSANLALNTCTLCGDCMTGCNVGAKDSLEVNLLLKARRRGAEIYTGASVLSLHRSEQKPELWELEIVHTDPQLQRREPGPLWLRARRVILAAGTLGSSEILLRSRSESLNFSNRLGEGFSCNGDNIAAAHRLAQPADGCADEQVPLDCRRVGPTITGSIQVTAGAHDRGFLVQEFSVPGPMKRLFEEIVTTARVLGALPEADETVHGGGCDPEIDPMAVDADAMQRTLLIGVIGHDDARGTLHLPVQPLAGKDRRGSLRAPGSVRIRWPGARDACVLDGTHERLKTLVDATPAALIANPMWRLLPPELEQLVSQPRGPVLTVHPLGGCALAASPRDGVVDEFGRVFDLDDDGSGASWFGSLAVLDGSVIPASLGVNPALTITALAMRAAEHLLANWGLTAAADAPWPEMKRLHAPGADRARPLGPLAPTEVAIVERLRGPVPLLLRPNGERPRDCIVELTLAYQPKPLHALVSTLAREVQVEAVSGQSRLRIYDEATWNAQSLRMLTDLERAPFLLFDAPLHGRLRFLHREASTPWQRRSRALRAWLVNRGTREIWQGVKEWLADSVPPRHCDLAPPAQMGLGARARELWRSASLAGEVRRFDYELAIGSLAAAYAGLGIVAGDRVEGAKRLTYGRRASPWRQLSEMQLTRMPAMHGLTRQQLPVLELDPGFLAAQGLPLLEITRQHSHADALAEMFSFGLAIGRLLLSTHLWSFRKPDEQTAPEPGRLPGPIRGINAPEITELTVGRVRGSREPVKVRLTRYPPTQASDSPPLVMLHGYSVSGNTFTHPALVPGAAEFFASRGRDVWVVDLRTSTGMPTAGENWAMEQAALIDIPAALLHVRNATRQRVDVLAHCIGCVMLGMALLSDARKVRSGETELGPDTWLTADHLGTLAAFNGPNPTGGAHPCVRRVVLSQKGPVLRYTDRNIFQAFVMQSVRRWLLADDYQFRPPRRPRVSDQLLDRLLASLPYPDEDYDIENPLTPWKKTPWTATRHRMDALYGRDFNAANLNGATLAAIDDLFGPINLDTVAQTIHFARYDAITSQNGRGEYVTRQCIRDRWGGIPTLALHGQDNGLVDVDTQQLLARHLGGNGVPFRFITYRGIGHQDLLIGTSSKQVFADIEAFLDEPQIRPEQALPMPGDLLPSMRVLDTPWMGPVIDLPDRPDQPVRLACMSRPDQGRSRLWLVPARMTLAGTGPAFEICDLPDCAVAGDMGGSDGWLFATPPCEAAWPAADGAAAFFGWFALLVYPLGETTATAPNFPQPATRRRALPPAHDDPQQIIDSARHWLAAAPPGNPRLSFVRADDLRRAEPQADNAAPLRFALASCQYPTGLLDRPVARAGIAAMARVLDELDLALFVGDQIYADATAGLVDPVRRDERYDWPNEKALRLPPLREVMRRIPTHALIDDHEISDNWEPIEDDRRRDTQRTYGVRAYWKYQRRRPLATKELPLADLAFNFHGHPFYLLDTRGGRQPRHATMDAAAARIMAGKQWCSLSNWLCEHRHALKFVVTPSLLLPRRWHSGADPSSFGHSDAWDGYPGSMQQLFTFIVDEDIRNTVFLSGDEHHSLFSEVKLCSRQAALPAVKLLCVHSSALYAPFPFANGSPTDLAERETFELGGIIVKVEKTTFARPGDGFARLEVAEGRGGQAALRIGFAPAEPGQPTEWHTVSLGD